jgi:OOP family OmpA-OmpF porin
MTQLVATPFAPGTRERRRSWNRLVLLSLAVLATAVAAILVSVPRIESGLEARVESALVSAGVTGHDVVVSGREVTVIGPEAEAAAEVARTVDGVRSVDATETRPEVRVSVPTELTVTAGSDRIVLAGAVPDERSRALALAAANRAFPDVVDRLTIGADDEPAWLDGLGDALSELLRIGDAELVLSGDTLTLTGTVIDVPTRREIAATLAEAMPTLEQSVELTLESGEPTQSANPELVQDLLDDLLEQAGAGAALFRTGSGDLTDGGEALFDAVGAVLLEHPGTAIEIGGHTDNSGSEEGNQRLSEERAAAAKNHLVALGVNPGLIDPRGYGESQPVTTNETREGRAANRRVTLTVIG